MFRASTSSFLHVTSITEEPTSLQFSHSKCQYVNNTCGRMKLGFRFSLPRIDSLDTTTTRVCHTHSNGNGCGILVYHLSHFDAGATGMVENAWE
jgi:hypothetical protein